jgi:hypothetical protein
VALVKMKGGRDEEEKRRWGDGEIYNRRFEGLKV